MRLAIATDAWLPQVNGVVMTLTHTVAELNRRGWETELLTPDQFATIPMPGYASIRLAMAPRFGVRRRLTRCRPDLVHIATEGPIGWAARGWCLANDVPYTSAFHTRFPEYASVRTGISPEVFWPIIRHFHAGSRAILVSTPSLARELTERGFSNIHPWSRGIDGNLFQPEGELHPAMRCLHGPVLLYVGRVAPEKNLDAFLSARTRGTKVIIGDGPALGKLRRKFPETLFLGALSGEALASAYRSADCFVFPSVTDTFGVVVIEALACGVPVAAFPVTGPMDILGLDGRGLNGDLAGPAGVLADNIVEAIERALCLDRRHAAQLGARFTWEAATDQFQQAAADALAYTQSAGARLAA